MFCKVKHCRYPNTHVTKGHKCGNCGGYGHGVLECRNISDRESLRIYHESLPYDKWCSIDNCSYKQYHITCAHQCKKCHNLGYVVFHGEDTCNIKTIDEFITMYRDANILEFNSANEFYDKYPVNQLPDNHYLVIQLALGSRCYIRNKNNELTCFIMHQDDWGQYGTSTHIIFEKFLEDMIDYEEINKFKDTDCPICRTLNPADKIIEIKGLEEQCKVCLDNSVEILLGECKHAVVCKECLMKL